LVSTARWLSLALRPTAGVEATPHSGQDATWLGPAGPTASQPSRPAALDQLSCSNDAGCRPGPADLKIPSQVTLYLICKHNPPRSIRPGSMSAPSQLSRYQLLRPGPQFAAMGKPIMLISSLIIMAW
jgi:hypothetical protein